MGIEEVGVERETRTAWVVAEQEVCLPIADMAYCEELLRIYMRVVGEGGEYCGSCEGRGCGRKIRMEWGVEEGKETGSITLGQMLRGVCLLPE